MNKYKVTRHRERNGVETTKDSVVFAKSEERAISIVRYNSTRSDKLPNGELTNYTTDDGAHIWWTAELVELDHPEAAPAPELETGDELAEAWARLMDATTPEAWTVKEFATEYFKTHPDAYSSVKSAGGAVLDAIKALNIASVNNKKNGRKYPKEAARKIYEYVDAHSRGKAYVKPKTTPAPATETETASSFSLSDDLEARVANFAELFNTNRDEIIARAVISYLNRLGGMTLNELIRRKEAKHGNT